MRRTIFAYSRSLRLPLIEPPRKRKRHRRTHHEQEQRHDEIPGREPFPCDMFELVFERRRHFVDIPRNEGNDRQKQLAAAHDPEHVEAAQGVDGRYPIARGRRGGYFGF